LPELSVTVVGAGVVGLCVALRLQHLGAKVLLLDDEASAPNASAVAAGMVAPAAEAAFDEAASGRLALLRAAAELWAETVSPSHLVRCGSMVVGLDDDAFALEQGAEALEREGAKGPAPHGR
jgi:glycine oxidase